MNADANKGGKRPGINFQLAKNQFHKSVIMLPNINVRLRVMCYSRVDSGHIETMKNVGMKKVLFPRKDKPYFSLIKWPLSKPSIPRHV